MIGHSELLLVPRLRWTGGLELCSSFSFLGHTNGKCSLGVYMLRTENYVYGVCDFFFPFRDGESTQIMIRRVHRSLPRCPKRNVNRT
jgi:hypothetical protein